MLLRLAKGCDWQYLSDATGMAAQKWLADRRAGGLSVGASNSFIRAAKHFFNWLRKERRISENPLDNVSTLNSRVDRRRERRALTLNEIGRLLIATMNAEAHHGLSGYERSLLYRLAIETGLRWSELRSLHRSSFDFQGNPASVTIAAEDEKAGRGDTLPLRMELATDLKAYLALHLPTAKAFPMWKDKGAEMLRKDLEAAGIPIKDEYGRVIDFHALRHTFGSMLAAAGVHPKVAQDLMRHSTINLTMNIYTHTALESRLDALSKLPDIKAERDDNEEDAVTVG
jgi:integrase